MLIKSLLFIFISVFFISCADKQEAVKVEYVYVDKVKYVYLPCQKPAVIKQKESVPENKPKQQAIKKVKKYKEPKPTKLYAPKKYQVRENKKMDFMLGINDDGSKFVYLEGEFGANTYKNFLSFIQQTGEKINEIKISSNGGLVSTAMQLGAYVYDNRWNTGVDKEMHCYSACGFVYFAGREKSLEGTATVGLHRPYLPGVADTQESIRKTKQDYISYWNYIHASKSVYDEMMEIDRDKLFILNRENINDYIDVQID